LRELLAMAKANQANPVPDFKLKMQVASWNRIAKSSGAEYMYLSTEVYNPESAPVPVPEPVTAPQQFDEDIPF
jgi:hypothetical protein